MLIIFLSVIFVVVVVFILYSVRAVFIDSRYEVQRKNLIAHCNKKTVICLESRSLGELNCWVA